MKYLKLLFLFLLSNIAFSETEFKNDDVYKSKYGIVQNIIKGINGDTNSYSIGSYAELILVKSLEEKNWEVKLLNNSINTSKVKNMAPEGDFYAISEENLKNYFFKKGPSYGVLSIPFKMRFKPFSITSGGGLGMYIGGNLIRKKGNTLVLLGFASITTVALNDINNENVDTKIAFSGGTGIIYKLKSNFQIGAITGVDLYDGVEKSVYGYAPWLSLSIGYTFIE